MVQVQIPQEREAGGDEVPLDIAIAARPDLRRVPALLGADELPWLGERLPASSDGLRRYLCDLELPAGALGPLTFHKAAIVGLGAPTPQADGWSMLVTWRATSFAPLFPVLAGAVTIERERLVLAGRYAPPGGRVGMALDDALLRVAARGAGRWFLATVAGVLG